MQVTVREAAEALNLASFKTIGHWYNMADHGRLVYVPERAVLDTEDFCRCIGLDHKTFVAFLTGYDMALTRKEAAEVLRGSVNSVKRFKPVFNKTSTSRWSFRELAAIIVKRMEKKHEAPKLAAGCKLLPPAKEIPGFDICEPVKP